MEAISQNSEANAEAGADLEALRENVAELREQLEAFTGENLTGEKLAQADALAKSLMEAEAAVAAAEAAERAERSAMPEQPPEGYGGQVIEVDFGDRQFRAPAEAEQTTVVDVDRQRAA